MSLLECRQNFDRRTLLKAAFNSLLVGESTYFITEQKNSLDPDFNMDWISYVAIDRKLVTPITIEEIKESEISSELLEARFRVDDQQPVIMTLRTNSPFSNRPEGHILKVSVEGQHFERIAPIVISANEDEFVQEVFLGDLVADSKVRIQNQTGKRISMHEIIPEFTRQEVEDPIADLYRQYAPYLAGSIDELNDMFVCIFGHIDENDDFYKFSYSGLRTDEDGGISDEERYRRYRSYRDADGIINVLMRKQNLEVVSIIFQGKDHIWKRHDGYVLDNTHPYFRYSTKNHMGTDVQTPFVNASSFITTVPLLLKNEEDEVDIRMKYLSIDALSKREVNDSRP